MPKIYPHLPKSFVWSFLALGLVGCEPVLEQLLPLIPVETPTQTSPQTPTQTSPSPEVATELPTHAEMEAAVREQINQVRLQNGLNALSNNEQLAQVARNYSQQMARDNFFSHTGSDGSTLAERVEAGGVRYQVVGENLFKSTNAPEPVPLAVEGWMESQGHRENILRPVFTETGIGVWQVGNTYYITQLFLRP